MIALTSRISCEVSISSRSTPPWINAAACSTENILKLREGDGHLRIGERGQLAGWPDRTRDEARVLRRGEFVRNAARQPGSGQVDLGDAFTQAVFCQRQAVGTEGIGYDHIHPGFQEGAVDLFNGSRVTDHQIVDAAVGLFTAILLRGQMHGLQVGAHDTAGNQHAF